METVCVAVGARGVDVVVEKGAVFVVGSVSAGITVEVELQANDVNIKRIGKTSFRLIR